MSHNRSGYIVSRPEETRATGSPASSYIPTHGAATKAVDQYRTVGIYSNGLANARAAFTDVTAVASLSKIAEGGLSDIKDIQAAETGLQALLLHDVVHVLVPAPKIDHGNGFISYLRNDNGIRTQFGFDLFSAAQSRDWLIAGEFIEAQDNKIVNSTLNKSTLIGHSLDDLRSKTYLNKAAAESINVTVEMHKVPAYLTDPELIIPRAGDGFPKHFYHRFNTSWKSATGGLPPIVCTFDLPPLLAIVLNRLNNREDLLDTVVALREELQPVREELHEFNQIITAATSSAEIERRVKHIEESFDSIVPETRMSGVEKRRRGILKIHRLVKPLAKFAVNFATGNGASWEDALGAFNGIEENLYENDAIVQRTITAQTFKNLLDTDGLQSLVKHHFYDSEISAIEKSLRK